MLTKIFIGARVTPELRGALNNQVPDELLLIPHQGKEYIGFYLEPSPKVGEIRGLCNHLTTILQTHCPDLREGHFHVVVFPQLFLG